MHQLPQQLTLKLSVYCLHLTVCFSCQTKTSCSFSHPTDLSLLLSDTAARRGISSFPVMSYFQVCSVQACMHICTCICGCTYTCVHEGGDLGLISYTLSSEAESLDLQGLMEWLPLLATFIWGPLALPSEARVTGARPRPPIIYVKSRESNSGPPTCSESTLTTKTTRFSFMVSLFFMKVTILPCGFLSVNANTKFYIADSLLNFSLTFLKQFPVLLDSDIRNKHTSDNRIKIIQICLEQKVSSHVKPCILSLI